ncbi:FGGY family carbohydrate kinase [Nitzschia inconspicua]|uniref:glycerol kinase n=1 Tax=Nitzschia inconspicua TaxID=303405 RepID=A0A9K3K8N3_9STRA|nr:FGGY family carbohydrate kinase [Nitzschia inconspicua]KAG7367099.1 FGGY family carbohydrate kinase [Nitzschia inconspicua]
MSTFIRPVTIVLLQLCLVVAVVTDSTASATPLRKVVIGVDGGTESIRACCFDAETGDVLGKPCASPYTTFHPQPSWAEQDTQDWWDGMGKAVRGAVASLKETSSNEDFAILSICVDTTCCTVVALDKNKQPLRDNRCILWMDARSAPQTKEIMETCRGDPALNVNCGGEGPISAEWFIPKALWIRENEPHVWDRAETICEYQDYINYKLTGELCACTCNAATRWHWDGEAALYESSPDQPYPGRPLSLYRKLGIPELAKMVPQKVVPMGGLVGHLSNEASEHLNLPSGIPVAQGGPDAFVGMIGLGCIHPGQLCLITGSSHLHCVVSSLPSNAPGIWGAYKGAPLPGLSFAEGGQSSTGSIIRWARNILGQSDLEYKYLDAEADQISPGCDGLIALETFQGSRTPVTDPLARGALVGLTLSHTRAHIWRALMEAVAFGTRGCLEGLQMAGHPCDEIIIAGGATRSSTWLQMHADVTGKPVVVCEFSDAPLLGCAILASVNAGVQSSIEDAVQRMVRQAKRIEPSQEAVKTYDELYKVYSALSEATRPVVHAIASIRGGKIPTSNEEPGIEARKNSSPPIISPSLLACDWSKIGEEVRRCMDAGAARLHVDIFDGVFLDSPLALTFGPQMVAAIRRCSQEAILDLHMCVERPARYIGPMKEAGGTTFIFQWESVLREDDPIKEALLIAASVRDHGMECGISINPSTMVEDIFPLLNSGLVAIVDVLSVEPGFGGQSFQDVAVEKIEKLLRFREGRDNPLEFKILVDGGINTETAGLSKKADILVAGTYLFQHNSMSDGIKELLSSCIDDTEV